jgi:hypothetical protein
MPFGVMAGHSRPKDGVASLAYVPAIHVFLAAQKQDVDARHKAGHDDDGKRRAKLARRNAPVRWEWRITLR